MEILQSCTKPLIIILSTFLWNYSTGPHWWQWLVDIALGDGLVPSGTKPLAGPMVPVFYNAILVMTWYLMARGHYLNQCWLLMSGVLWHSPESNFTTLVTNLCSAFGTYTCRIAITSPRSQWVNIGITETATIHCNCITRLQWVNWLTYYFVYLFIRYFIPIIQQ